MPEQRTTGSSGPSGPVLVGRVWRFGDHVDTDAVIPARHCNTADPAILAQHCMEDADSTFAAKVQPGDVIVAGANFGCGSSREVAPIAIRAAGVSAVIAASFARIFFRNAINLGLPILECPEAAAVIEAGERVEIDPAQGSIRSLTTGRSFQAQPFPDFLLRIIALGGLHGYVELRLKERAGALAAGPR
jgi:3-isopropylmalate/(R)-2-methylmalate dehydratase small subunit